MAYVLKDENGEAIKRQGEEVYAHDRSGVVKGIDREKRTLTIIGSDETTDRDGDVLSVKGWQLDNFLKNPVFLYAHNYSSVPIGSALKVFKRKDPVRLEFVEKFPSEGLYPFADMIFELFNEKILNASSVGFLPKKWEPIQEKNELGEMISQGRKYLEQELLELSACPVPSNPNALQNAIKFMQTTRPDQMALITLGQMDLDLKRDEVLGELSKEVEFEDENEIKSFVPANYEVTKEEEFVTVKGEHEKEKEVTIEKSGAVLNAKNKDRLLQVKTLVDGVLSDAGVSAEDEGETEEESFASVLVSLHNYLSLQLGEMKTELAEISSFIKSIKSQPKGNEIESVPVGETLQDEYEKLLSHEDNEQAHEEDGGLTKEEQEIIAEVVNTLKAKLAK